MATKGGQHGTPRDRLNPEAGWMLGQVSSELRHQAENRDRQRGPKDGILSATARCVHLARPRSPGSRGVVQRRSALKAAFHSRVGAAVGGRTQTPEPGVPSLELAFPGTAASAPAYPAAAPRVADLPCQPPLSHS